MLPLLKNVISFCIKRLPLITALSASAGVFIYTPAEPPPCCRSIHVNVK